MVLFIYLFRDSLSMSTQTSDDAGWVPLFDGKPLPPLDVLETMATFNVRPNRDVELDWNNPLTKRFTNGVNNALRVEFELSVIMLFRLKGIPRGKADPKTWGIHFACWMVSRLVVLRVPFLLLTLSFVFLATLR